MKHQSRHASCVTYRQDNELLQRLYVLDALKLIAEQGEISELGQLAEAFQLADVVEGQVQPS